MAVLNLDRHVPDRLDVVAVRAEYGRLHASLDAALKSSGRKWSEVGTIVGRRDPEPLFQGKHRRLTLDGDLEPHNHPILGLVDRISRSDLLPGYDSLILYTKDGMFEHDTPGTIEHMGKVWRQMLAKLKNGLELTDCAIAEQMGVPYTNFSGYLNSHASPQLEVALRINSALGLTMDYFVPSKGRVVYDVQQSDSVVPQPGTLEVVHAGDVELTYEGMERYALFGTDADGFERHGHVLSPKQKGIVFTDGIRATREVAPQEGPIMPVDYMYRSFKNFFEDVEPGNKFTIAVRL